VCWSAGNLSGQCASMPRCCGLGKHARATAKAGRNKGRSHVLVMGYHDISHIDHMAFEDARKSTD
jgi:hypothetical protein